MALMDRNKNSISLRARGTEMKITNSFVLSIAGLAFLVLMFLTKGLDTSGAVSYSRALVLDLSVRMDFLVGLMGKRFRVGMLEKC
jgi:hypothetical protein